MLAGFFIALFASFFFLYEGDRIWSWVVALFPRAAREQVDSSGHTAWVSLTAFVRATVLVALTDAIGIAVGAWILGVPLTFAIGVLVFLGAFIPIIGALLSGHGRGAGGAGGAGSVDGPGNADRGRGRCSRSSRTCCSRS